MQADSDDNSESFFVPFLFFSCLWAHICHSVSKNALLCVNEGVMCCGRARSLLHPGEWTGPKPHPRPFLQSLLPCPALSWDVSVGDGFPGNRLPSALQGWCGAACWRWQGRWWWWWWGVILGWNSHMSHKSKVNNFQPLLTKCLCPLPPPPHPSR